MTNYHFMMLAPPDRHREVLKQINKWKYSVEGRHARGDVSPMINELRYYEVRIPDEAAPQFIRDFDLEFKYKRFSMARSIAMRAMYSAFAFVLWFTPFKRIRTHITEKKNNLSRGFQYVFPIGKLDRAPKAVLNGKSRKVL